MTTLFQLEVVKSVGIRYGGGVVRMVEPGAPALAAFLLKTFIHLDATPVETQGATAMITAVQGPGGFAPKASPADPPPPPIGRMTMFGDSALLTPAGSLISTPTGTIFVIPWNGSAPTKVVDLIPKLPKIAPTANLALHLFNIEDPDGKHPLNQTTIAIPVDGAAGGKVIAVL